MSERRGARRETRRFTIEQLRSDRPMVVSAAKQDGGCIVVDKKGKRLFSLWIPQEPLGSAD